MTSFSPRFVRARILFKHGDKTFQAGEHLINSTGLPGFAWSAFDPFAELGKRVKVAAQVLTATPWEFHCEASITCEQSATGKNMGLNFILTDTDRAKLDEAVAKEGVLPDYVRKFPRLHYMPRVPIFPSRALVRFFYNHEDIAVACDVENISPSGVMVHTDDARTGNLQPDETVRVQLQPRGGWLRAIHFNAQLKRVTHTVEPGTNNVRRYFGLSLTTMSGEAKINFTDLLKQIILNAKK